MCVCESVVGRKERVTKLVNVCSQALQTHQVPTFSPTPHWQIWYTVSYEVLLNALAMTWNRVGDPETSPV